MATITRPSGDDAFTRDPGRAIATGTPAASWFRNPRPLRCARRLLAAAALVAGLVALPIGAAAQTIEPGDVVIIPGDGSIIVNPDPFSCDPPASLIIFNGILTCVDFPVIRGCGGPHEIFQVCGPGGSASSVSRFPLHDVVQDEAVEDLLAAHKLPAADKAKVFGFARDDVRADIYAKLLEMAAKTDGERTANEQAIVDFYAGLLQEQRIFAAQTSINEYNIWAGNPCGYVPPDGFSYTPNQQLCSQPGGGLGGLFDTVSPPPLKDFQTYGAAAAYATFDDPKAAQVASAAALSMGAKIGLGTAGAVAAGAITGAVIKAAAAAIFPYAIKVGMVGLVGSAAAFGAATIVVLAVIIAVIKGSPCSPRRRFWAS